MNNYFYSLPCDIQIYIIQISSANIIIHYWYKYIKIKLLLQQRIMSFETFDVCNYIVANTFSELSRVISPRIDDTEYWIPIIKNFGYNLIVERYKNMTRSPFSSYNISYVAHLTLIIKLKLKPTEIDVFNI